MKRDHQQQREARKYERPIPSRDYILQLLETADRPLGFDAIAEGLELSDEVDLEALTRRLRAMVRDGQLIRNRRGDYCLVDRVGVISGTVIGHRDGFGFLKPDHGGEDLFISPRQMRELMHGDRVAVRVSKVDKRGKREASLVEVLERNTEELVGQYVEESGVGFVVPDNARYSQDVIVPDSAKADAHSGQIVIAAIVEHPTKRTQPIGKIVRILGEQREPGLEVEIALNSHGIPHEWPEGVEEQADEFGVNVPEDAKEGRVDLRDVPLVTIDDITAKDFDDAVYCERAGDGWCLTVAIADVSHYVHPDSPLDREANRRATSVYFPGEVVPMLPEVLSNGLCSINPKVDRLCLAVEMRVDAEGRVKSSKFMEAVMRSHARLTYEQVAAMLYENDTGLRDEYRHVLPCLEALDAVYRKFAAARRKRGAIEFESVEPKFVFGPERKIERIEGHERNDAHKIIEECMIAANVEGAKFLKKNRMPTLFRVHESPDPDKVEDLREFLAPLGLSLGGGVKPKAKDYSKLMQQVQGRSDAQLIQTVMLRSLNQAVYSPDDVGHFGLAHETYLHFTSPIRRYPDLLVHRAIRHVLREGDRESFPYRHGDMERLGTHCSMAERRADEATRDAADWLKCEFMQDKVGNEYDAMIVGVTNFGVFVQLKGMFVEGLIHVTTLNNDYYRFDSVRHQLVGERSGRIYRLTDPLRVRVMQVNLDERKIDFEPVDEAPVALEGPPAGATEKERRKAGQKVDAAGREKPSGKGSGGKKSGGRPSGDKAPGGGRKKRGRRRR